MFFSDLDRTLIYSKGFLESCTDKYVCVEKKEGKEISYMTEKSVKMFKLLRKRVNFVPVTARTFSEITRIDFIRNNMPTLMICESGCALYINGVRDYYWDNRISQLVKQLGSKVDQAHSSFRMLVEGREEVVRETNKHMLMSKFSNEDMYDKEYLLTLSDYYSNLGFSFELQAPRKIYLTPEIISKGEAVRELISYYSPEVSISAGDAEMDHSMFQHTNIHIAPNGHTISKEVSFITSRTGLLAGEDIINEVLKLTSK